MNSRKLPKCAAFALMLVTGVASAALAGGSAANPPAKAAGDSKQAVAGGHSHKQSELHGGQVTMTKRHHLETVFGADGLRIYRYSDKQLPELAGKAAGSVTFEYPDGKTQTVLLVAQPAAGAAGDVWFCTMHPDQMAKAAGTCPVCKMKLVAQNSLFATADLSKATPGALKASVTLEGLEGEEPQVTFVETYQGAARKPMNQ